MFTSGLEERRIPYKAGFGCLDGSESSGGILVVVLAFGWCHCPPGSRAISLQCNGKLRVSDK